MSRPSRVALALALVSVLAGCSFVPVRTTDGPLPPPAVVHPSWSGCRDVVPDVDLGEPNDRPDQGRVPDGFGPVAAVRCSAEWSAESSGEDRAEGVEQRTGETSLLVEALSGPSEQPARLSGEVSCTADAWGQPWLFLIDRDGRWIAPQIPTDVCGKPRDRTAVDASGWPVDRRWALDRAVIEAPERAGCTARHYDPHLQNRPGPSAEQIPVTALAGPVRALCRFSVASAANPQVTPTGHFASGRRLSVADGTTVRTAVASSPASTCRQAATEFVVLYGPDNETRVLVELDGCRRVLTDLERGPRAGQAGDRLLALIS